MYKEPKEQYKYKDRVKLPDVEQSAPVHKICCPSCDHPVPATDINIQTNIAKCTQCDSIFSIENEIDKLHIQSKKHKEIERPEGVEIWQDEQELDIGVSQPWSAMEIIGISFIPLVPILTSAYVVETVPPTTFAKISLIALWASFLVGILSYFYFRKKHKLYIHIDEEDLYLERRPRKLVKDKRYAIKDIDQVYIKNVTASSGTKTVGVFMIVNGIDGQKHIPLISALENRSQGQYIEQEIERHLGIVDRHVPDEMA